MARLRPAVADGPAWCSIGAATLVLGMAAAGIGTAHGLKAARRMGVGTGDPRWRRRGVVILKWALIAAAGFFGVLILERLALML